MKLIQKTKEFVNDHKEAIIVAIVASAATGVYMNMHAKARLDSANAEMLCDGNVIRINFKDGKDYHFIHPSYYPTLTKELAQS